MTDAAPDWYSSLPDAASPIAPANDAGNPSVPNDQGAPDWYNAAPDAVLDQNVNQMPNAPGDQQAIDQSHEMPPSDLTGQAIRQTGLTSRDLLETAVGPFTGVGDLANMGINFATGQVNKLTGSTIPQLGMPTQDVSDMLTKVGLPQPETTSEKLGSAATKIGSQAAMMGENLVPTAKALYENAADLFAKEPPATAEGAKAIANQFYQQADEKGGVFSPDFTDSFLARMNGKEPTTPTEIIAAKSDPLRQFASDYSSIAGQPMTLSDAQLLDERMGDFIDGEYSVKGMSKQGRNMLQAQHDFRDMMRSAADNGQVMGGQEGLDAWQNGQQAWSQAAKMQDVNRIMMRAQGSENPDTIMRTGVRTMLANPLKTRGWSDDEIAALTKARDPSMLQGTMKLMGSKLIPIIAAAGEGVGGGGVTGGLISGGVAHALTGVPRNIAQNMQASKMQNVLNVLGKNIPPAQ